MNKGCQPTPTIQSIRQALAGPLPGQAGQAKMAPVPGQDRWSPPDNCRQASVLILLYPNPANGSNSDTLHVALIRRPDYPGVHGGQISFPGGQREAAESLQQTALRETKEEIGVPAETIELLGRLSSLYIPPSNYCIYPFVGWSPIRPTFRLDSREVAELIETPLPLLLEPATRREEIWHFERAGPRRIPFFYVDGHKVWGATAMMLSEFLTILSKTST